MLEEPSNMNVSVLDPEHAESFKQALDRLLSTDVAEVTYSEIVDGLPTIDSFFDFHFEPEHEGHPVLALDHASLCPGVVERTREFREQFDALQLTLPSALLSAFQQSHPESQEFELRLIELLAVSCHQIGVHLFELDDGVHKHRLYEEWRHSGRKSGEYFAPTAFFHGSYVDSDQYPNGVADVVGYWAEAKIFGGVVVFDRGPSGTECRGLFLHPATLDGPRTIFPPTPAQYTALIDFLLSPAPAPGSCPVPIRATADNRWRYDPWDSIARFNIFRDRYERKPPSGPRPQHCVKSSRDWPELGDEHLVTLLQYQASQGLPVDQAEIDAAYERMKQITPSSPLWPSGRDPGLR